MHYDYCEYNLLLPITVIGNSRSSDRRSCAACCPANLSHAASPDIATSTKFKTHHKHQLVDLLSSFNLISDRPGESRPHCGKLSDFGNSTCVDHSTLSLLGDHATSSSPLSSWLAMLTCQSQSSCSCRDRRSLSRAAIIRLERQRNTFAFSPGNRIFSLSKRWNRLYTAKKRVVHDLGTHIYFLCSVPLQA